MDRCRREFSWLLASTFAGEMVFWSSCSLAEHAYRCFDGCTSRWQRSDVMTVLDDETESDELAFRRAMGLVLVVARCRLQTVCSSYDQFHLTV